MVLATSMLVTAARKEVVENAKDGENLGITARANKDNENLSLA